MRDLAGRVLVAVPLLVAVLAAAYFDGWWLFAVAAVGAILALHELYTTIRPLRPLVLAGFAGVIAALLGAELGGPGWLLAGLLSTFVFAFGLYGDRGDAPVRHRDDRVDDPRRVLGRRRASAT